MRKKRMMRAWLPVFIACACSVLLCCGRSQQENRASSQNGNAPVESQNSNAPRYVSAQFAESAKSLARADLLDCRNTDSKITRGSDLSVEEVAKRLQGTWVRRLTMHGVPIETNSFLYFDMKGANGKGTAMLLDRVNLGPDTLPGHTTAIGPPLKTRLAASYIERIENGLEPGAELLLPSVTGVLWEVNLSATQATQGGERTQGHMGVAIQLNGEYRGTGTQFPPGGINYTERAEFFKEGEAYVLVSPWVSPASGYGASYLWDNVVMSGDPSISLAAFQSSDESLKSIIPSSLTFVNCPYQFVDKYVKVSNDLLQVEGTSLREAWEKLKADGSLEQLPGFGRKTKAISPWP